MEFIIALRHLLKNKTCCIKNYKQKEEIVQKILSGKSVLRLIIDNNIPPGLINQQKR